MKINLILVIIAILSFLTGIQFGANEKLIEAIDDIIFTATVFSMLMGISILSSIVVIIRTF